MTPGILTQRDAVFGSAPKQSRAEIAFDDVKRVLINRAALFQNACRIARSLEFDKLAPDFGNRFRTRKMAARVGRLATKPTAN